MLSRAEASGSNPAKLSLNLLEALFSRDEMAASNINGARGRELLDPIKIKGIQGEFLQPVLGGLPGARKGGIGVKCEKKGLQPFQSRTV